MMHPDVEHSLEQAAKVTENQRFYRRVIKVTADWILRGRPEPAQIFEKTKAGMR